MAPGIQATTTFSQREIVSILTTGFDLSLNWKGNIFCQNRMTTARIAPSWITTKNISLKASLMFRVRNSSTNSMWPVLLMGSHSVMPSTMPRKMTFRISVKLRATFERPPCHKPVFRFPLRCEVRQVASQAMRLSRVL